MTATAPKKIWPNDIADAALSAKGEQFYEWASRSMPVLGEIAERFAKEKPLAGKRIAACLHITSETANLVTTLQSAGAEVFLCASNPLSTQDAITAFLVSRGVHVYAIHGEDLNTYFAHCNAALDAYPHIVIDDGGDLTRLLHTDRTDARCNLVGGLEETTTGIVRIKSLEADGKLKYPILAINNAKTKHMFDNRYGTGQSTIDAILRATNTLLAGKRVVVAGFGMCGRGVAMRAHGMGAEVIVTEIDHVRALEAAMEGYRVMSMIKAAEIGDIFVTVTGNKSILTREHFERMRDGALLANSGHFDVEIDLVTLRSMAKNYQRLRSSIEEYTLASGVRLIVLGEGRLVNLAAAEGHPANVMDMSFANQALGCEYIMKKGSALKIEVFDMPVDIDNQVARLKLESMGIEIDTLTPGQVKYLNSWEEGT
jgi:adenosylhomocysteinase